ncbi:hypothetical protein [Actinoplanes sp. L3-i22]|uniref:hypothetical protein n=1 Tax=Actinoplanes sp. L3-i22 TaxID=2836373 RepID=UPI001C7872ED|nr:hypothetical protein [Actinoplanes sp. L3-i22]BCY14252.1 hypothetical protein L3i22_093400 [Actinoplanes sp. L3-i22]
MSVSRQAGADAAEEAGADAAERAKKSEKAEKSGEPADADAAEEPAEAAAGEAAAGEAAAGTGVAITASTPRTIDNLRLIVMLAEHTGSTGVWHGTDRRYATDPKQFRTTM